MNELANSLRVVNAALKTVRIMDMVKKAVICSAAAACCVFAFRYWHSR